MVRSLMPSFSLWHGIWSFPFVCFSLEQDCGLCIACYPSSTTLVCFGSAPVGRPWSIWYVFQFQLSHWQEAEIAAYSKQDFQHLWPNNCTAGRVSPKMAVPREGWFANWNWLWSMDEQGAAWSNKSNWQNEPESFIIHYSILGSMCQDACKLATPSNDGNSCTVWTASRFQCQMIPRFW